MLRRHASIGWAAQGRPLLGPALASAAMAVVIWSLREVVPPDLALLALIPLGGATYGAVLLVVDRAATRRLWRFFGAMMSGRTQPSTVHQQPLCHPTGLAGP